MFEDTKWAMDLSPMVAYIKLSLCSFLACQSLQYFEYEFDIIQYDRNHFLNSSTSTLIYGKLVAFREKLS